MRAKELVQSIIGSKGFVLEDITIDTEMNEIKLLVRPTKKERVFSETRVEEKAIPAGMARDAYFFWW